MFLSLWVENLFSDSCQFLKHLKAIPLKNNHRERKDPCLQLSVMVEPHLDTNQLAN